METLEPKKGIEFEPKNFFESFIYVAKEILLRPAKFFYEMPQTGGIRNPFIFLLVCSFLFSLFIANYKGGDFNLFLLYFFANTLSALLQSIIYHLLVSRLFGSKAPFEATFRIIAYINILCLVSWIPVVVFSLAINIFSLYLIFIGLQVVHKLKSKQAGITVLSFFAITLLFIAGLFLVAGGNMEESMKILNL